MDDTSTREGNGLLRDGSKRKEHSPFASLGRITPGDHPKRWPAGGEVVPALSTVAALDADAPRTQRLQVLHCELWRDASLRLPASPCHEIASACHYG